MRSTSLLPSLALTLANIALASPLPSDAVSSRGLPYSGPPLNSLTTRDSVFTLSVYQDWVTKERPVATDPGPAGSASDHLLFAASSIDGFFIVNATSNDVVIPPPEDQPNNATDRLYTNFQYAAKAFIVGLQLNDTIDQDNVTTYLDNQGRWLLGNLANLPKGGFNTSTFYSYDPANQPSKMILKPVVGDGKDTLDTYYCSVPSSAGRGEIFALYTKLNNDSLPAQGCTQFTLNTTRVG